MTCTTQAVRGAHRLDAIRAEWEALLSEVPDATVSDTWIAVRGAWRMSQDRIVPLIVTVRDDAARLVGVLPLGLTTKRQGPFSVPVLRIIAPRRLDTPGLLVHPDRDREVISLVGAWFANQVRRGMMIDLRPIRETNPLALALAGQNGRFHTTPMGGGRITPLPSAPGTWEAVIRDGRARREVARCQRRLKEEFGATSVSPTDPDALRAFATAFAALHSAEQARRGRQGALATEAARRWFPDFLVDLHDAGMLDTAALWHGDRMIAGYIATHFRGTSAGYRTAYDAEYRSRGPGTALLAAMLDRAIARGDRRWDFGLGDEGYKNRWATPSTGFVWITCAPRTPRYLLYRAWERAFGSSKAG
jgi:CelD/BcsL family acetyltransferase involved in cellulose biosynthesis